MEAMIAQPDYSNPVTASLTYTCWCQDDHGGPSGVWCRVPMYSVLHPDAVVVEVAYALRVLYIFCSHHLLCARLHTAYQDAAQAAVEELEGIVARIWARWPGVGILVQGDSGFFSRRENAVM